MTLLDLLNDKIFKFPHQGRSDFPQFVRNTLEYYFDSLIKVDDHYREKISQILNDVAKTCTGINDLIRLTYSGNLIESYDVLNTVLARLDYLAYI